MTIQTEFNFPRDSFGYMPGAVPAKMVYSDSQPQNPVDGLWWVQKTNEDEFDRLFFYSGGNWLFFGISLESVTSRVIDHNADESSHSFFLKINELASSASNVVVGGVLAKDLSSKFYVQNVFSDHNNSMDAHPELFVSFSEKVARAELAAANAELSAEAAVSANNTYASGAAGQADELLARGAYFWVVSSTADFTLELWRKGEIDPEDTQRRTVSAQFVRDNGTEDLTFNSELSFAVVTENSERSWIEADKEGKPTTYASDLIVDKTGALVTKTIPFENVNTQAFALIGEDDTRTWIEVDEEGGPTPHSINKFVEKLPSYVITEPIPQPELNKQGFALVGEDGSRTWLETDSKGDPTDYAVKKFSSKIGVVDSDKYVDSTGKIFKVSSGPDIVAWGDSMTAGATGIPYTTYLQTMLTAAGKSRNIFNYGVGGESSITITARSNANPFVVKVANDLIPASGRVALTLLPINGVRVEPIKQSGNFASTLAGISGIFGSTNTGGVYSYWFERSVAGEAVVAPRPLNLYLTNSELRRGDIAIIWIGQNQPNWVDGVNDYTRINERSINDAKAIIQYMTATDKRYLVISPPAGGSEKVPFDARWFEEFGQRYIPIREYITTPIYAGDGTTIINCYGLQDAGIAPVAQDLIDIGERRIPISFRNDGVHWKAAGYEVLAKLIYKKLTDLGWI